MSSRSNTTSATIRSSASISTMLSISVWNASGRWSRPEKRARVRTRRSPRVAMTVDVMFVTPMSAIARISCDLGIPTVSDPGVHHPTTIVDGNVVGQYLRHRRPSRGPRSTSRSARSTWLAAFSSRGAGRLSSSNRASAASRSASSNISSAADQVAVDRQKFDHPPLGVEALLRGPVRRVGDDRSEVAQPMHGLDVDAEVRRRGPSVARMYAIRSPGANAGPRRWSMLDHSPASWRAVRAG